MATKQYFLEQNNSLFISTGKIIVKIKNCQPPTFTGWRYQLTMFTVNEYINKNHAYSDLLIQTNGLLIDPLATSIRASENVALKRSDWRFCGKWP